jgi:hypothetical protein
MRNPLVYGILSAVFLFLIQANCTVREFCFLPIRACGAAENTFVVGPLSVAWMGFGMIGHNSLRKFQIVGSLVFFDYPAEVSSYIREGWDHPFSHESMFH